MSTRGPQTTSVGGGRAHTGRGEGGGAGMSFFEDFCGCGAANLTERFFLSFLGGGDFFFGFIPPRRAPPPPVAPRSRRCRSTPSSLLCCVGRWCRGGVGLPSQPDMEIGGWLSLTAVAAAITCQFSQAEMSRSSKFGDDVACATTCGEADLRPKFGDEIELELDPYDTMRARPPRRSAESAVIFPPIDADETALDAADETVVPKSAFKLRS